MTNLEFNDEELKTLSDLVRQAKVTATAEEILAVTLGQTSSPLLAVTYKVMASWQAREADLNKTADDAPSEVTE